VVNLLLERIVQVHQINCLQPQVALARPELMLQKHWVHAVNATCKVFFRHQVNFLFEKLLDEEVV